MSLHYERLEIYLPRCHDDVIKWKHFPRNWPFVRGIQMNSPHKWPVTRSFDVFFDLRLNKRLSKQSWGWWFEACIQGMLHTNEETRVLITSCKGWVSRYDVIYPPNDVMPACLETINYVILGSCVINTIAPKSGSVWRAWLQTLETIRVISPGR